MRTTTWRILGETVIKLVGKVYQSDGYASHVCDLRIRPWRLEEANHGFGDCGRYCQDHGT